MSLAKILLIMVTVNAMLYLAGAQLFDNDIFDRLATVDDDTGTVVDYGSFDDQLPNSDSVSAGSFSADSGGFSFFDALGMILSSLLFLVNLVFAPIAIFVATGMPLVLQLGIGIPVGILYMFGLIVLFRGGGA